MRLDEAQELFKDTIDRCPAFHRKNFLIILPEASPTNISEGYEVTIRVDAKSLDIITLNNLHDIAKRRNLEVMEASESIMFYESSERAKLKQALAELNFFQT